MGRAGEAAHSGIQRKVALERCCLRRNRSDPPLKTDSEDHLKEGKNYTLKKSFDNERRLGIFTRQMRVIPLRAEPRQAYLCTANPIILRLIGRVFSRDANHLRLHVTLEAQHRVFPANARLFGAAERDPRIWKSTVLIHPDGSCLQTFGDFRSFR